MAEISANELIDSCYTRQGPHIAGASHTRYVILPFLNPFAIHDFTHLTIHWWVSFCFLFFHVDPCLSRSPMVSQQSQFVRDFECLFLSWRFKLHDAVDLPFCCNLISIDALYDWIFICLDRRVVWMRWEMMPRCSSEIIAYGLRLRIPHSNCAIHFMIGYMCPPW